MSFYMFFSERGALFVPDYNCNRTDTSKTHPPTQTQHTYTLYSDPRIHAYTLSRYGVEQIYECV